MQSNSVQSNSGGTKYRNLRVSEVWEISEPVLLIS